MTEHSNRMIEWGRIWQKEPLYGLPADSSGFSGTGQIYYKILSRAQQAIDEHTYASHEVEVGGLLLGQVYQAGSVYLVLVTDILPARHTTSGSAFLTFTSQTWIDIIARRGLYPDKKTVGWYHSHPGMGIFLSGSDLFIHKSFFSDQTWYVALVVDPVLGEQGIFAWKGNEIEQCPDSAVCLQV